MRTLRLAQGLLLLSLAASVVGCERRAGEARPEPVSLSRPTPQRQGLEHGQDPRRPTVDGEAPRVSAQAEPSRNDGYAEADGSSDEASDESDEVADDEARERRPAKRRRTGGLAAREPSSQSESSFRAKRLVVAKKVDGREPVGVARSFDSSKVDEVAVFVELANDARESGKIVVRFEPPSAAPFEVKLEVGASPRWRTWATTKRPLEEGTWTVRVSDEAGALVGSTTFEVTE